MSSLSLRGVRKSYGSVEVIKGVDLDIKAKEFVVFVGPSGCGKSTLLRMIAGLEPITSGDLDIGGTRMNEVEPSKRGIAMVFQTYALYPHMTVYDNVGFGLKLAGTPKDVRDAKIREAAKILQMEHLLERKPSQLSGGQRQRVAIGRAIVRKPEVFLFDEPLSNLDAKLRVVMRGEIKGLHQRLGVTTVYVTHDQIEAMTMADRIVVMNGGKVEQVGAPLDLYDRPANLFVAGFIGSPAMNMLEGEITADGFHAGGLTLPLPSAITARGRAVCGIRPEHLVLAQDGLPAIVKLVEPMGSETQVTMALGDQTIIGVFRERLSAHPGETIHVRPALDSIHLFDATTGQRIN